MNDYLGQTKWALTRRASPWPALRLVLIVAFVAFLAGVLVGSVLSSKNAEGGFAPTRQPAYGSEAGMEPAVSLGATIIDGSTEPTRTTPQARGSIASVLPSGMAITPLEAEESRRPSLDGSTDVMGIIRRAAPRWGVDPDRMVRVARCESSLNPNAIGDQGRAVGLFQFHAETFFRMAAPLGIFEDLRTDPYWASEVAARAFSIGRAVEWSCR